LRRPASGRFGLTLMEVVIAAIIGLMVIMAVVTAYTRFSRMFGTATADLAVQVDTRVLFDNLSIDLASAVLVATGKDTVDNFDWKADQAQQCLQVFRLKKDPKDRHVAAPGQDQPPYPGYPSFREDGDQTVQKIPCLRELYETEAEGAGQRGFKVFRTEEDGFLVRTEGTPVCGKVPGFTYAFERKQSGRRTRMAANVKKLALVPLGFLPIQQPPAAANANAEPDPKDVDQFLTVWAKSKPCAQLYHIAGIGVHYLAEDIKQGALGNEGRVELVCKYWMEERSANFRFNRAFSSIDENL